MNEALNWYRQNVHERSYRYLLHMHQGSNAHRLDMTEVVRLEKPHLPHMNEVVISVLAEYVSPG